MSERTRIPDEVITEILTRSRRRCCLCYGLRRDGDTKQGQLAHLDQGNSNNRPENLAFLCLAHHDAYDSRTSQSKGFTIGEVKAYREELYSHVQKLALSNVIAPTSSLFTLAEEQEALGFHTGTHRSQNVVLLVSEDPKSLEEINSAIPPGDIEWTRTIVSDVMASGWVRRMPSDYRQFELSMNGRRTLEVLSLLSEDVKERAWQEVWRPDPTKSNE